MSASNSSLLAVKAALERLLQAFSAEGTETIALNDTVARVLAEEVRSGLDLPPFSNSSMDGFAVRPQDIAGASTENPIQLKVAGDIPAGKPLDDKLGPGEAMRIMTGAALPDGASAVIPVEDTDVGIRAAGSEIPTSISVYRSLRNGDYIREKGEDLQRGDPVLPQGVRLRAQDLGMLATLGYSQVNVYRRPTVAILSTGDELIPVEAELTPGKIRESNSHALASQVLSCGGEVRFVNVVRDDPAVIRRHLDQAVDTGVDLVISTAGVSVGAFDYVRSVVEASGHLDFWRVNMRPGKPITFGDYRELRFIGLPGNPVSAFVGFEVFVRPALNKLAGVANWTRNISKGVLAVDTSSDGRESYLRGIVRETDGRLVVESASHQGSGNLFSLVKANCLYIVPAGVKQMKAGDTVEIWPL